MQQEGEAMLTVEYAVALAVLMASVCIPRYKKYYVYAKALASASFLAVLLASCGNFLTVLPAFICCFFGDIFMGLYNRGRKKRHFLAGLFVFLFGHICFVMWLSSLKPLNVYEFILPAVCVVIIYGVTASKRVHTGRLRPFILLYSFFIALFLSKAVFLLLSQVSMGTILIACGAALFFLSDTTIIFLYFVKTKGKWIHIVNLGTYYIGMFILAKASGIV
jgi:uncharacterized membrane protein YhhN